MSRKSKHMATTIDRIHKELGQVKMDAYMNRILMELTEHGAKCEVNGKMYDVTYCCRKCYDIFDVAFFDALMAKDATWKFVGDNIPTDLIEEFNAVVSYIK